MSHIELKDQDANSVEIGYSLISEEHQPNDLVRNSQLAEAAGFNFATISDHFHPWISEQGNSPFVWAVIGAIAQVTKNLKIGTAVTCPIIRIHPAIVAQAAATAASMMPNRFFLGVGTGENLNEHISGSVWPSHEIRKLMLEEAVDIMRELWKGNNTTYYGDFYTVENARIYTLPKEPIPVIVAASGPKMAEAAAKFADGLMSTSPDSSILKAFKQQSQMEGPFYCQMTCCYAESEAEAKKIAYKQWPIAGLPDGLLWELKTPKIFEQISELVTEEQATKNMPCGKDPEKILESIKKYLDAGFRKVSIHNVGPNQEEFLKFYNKEVLPKVKKLQY